MSTILVVDDDAAQRSLLRTVLSEQGISVLEADSGNSAVTVLDNGGIDMVITDVRMRGMSGLELLGVMRDRFPDLPVLLVTAFADIKDAVSAMRSGAVNYLEKPIDFDELVECVRHALGTDSVTTAAADRNIPPLPEDVVANSKAMLAALREASLVAPTNSRVLITGESGTGKEVLARLIHDWSDRSSRQLLAVNCAAIPGNLLESELFGHERGAFTGAHQRRIGRFEEASGGTLFLDEIGEIAQPLQAKLLRVIQDGIIERIGSNAPIPVDVRIVSATNRNLEEEVASGRFREDLYYRLNVFELYLPPLRDRPEDILPLARAFAERYADMPPKFSRDLLTFLPLYNWPGNVRELQNAMERAVLLARGGALLREHLPRRIQDAVAAPTTPTEDGGPEGEGRMEQMERALILQTLRENEFNRTETARALGISRRALTYKIQRLREQGFNVNPS